MNPLPLGIPLPTALYTTLFVLTLALSMTFANYVLGGALWLAVRTLLRRGQTSAAPNASIADHTLRDWLTFMLSGAITAGVAPLLFVQILYQLEFYTANLLLWYWWLAMIPVLIGAFYALYALKTRFLAARPMLLVIVSIFAAACFTYVAWAWTHNHLLSTESQAVWSQTYATRTSGPMPHGHFARLAFFVFASIPGMAVILAWQLRDLERTQHGSAMSKDRKTLALAAAVTLMIALICGLVYTRLDPAARAAAVSPAAFLWLALALLGALGQFAAWHFLFRAPAFTTRLLQLATLSYGAWIVGTLFVREVIRRALFTPEALAALEMKHTEIFKTTDHTAMIVFFIFAGITLVLMTWIVRTVRAAQARV